MQIPDLEIRFIKTLNTLAIHAKDELSEENIALYDKALFHHGYDKAIVALEEILEEHRPGQPMPSIAEIERKIRKQTEVSEKSLALAAVSDVMKAVSTKGHTWPQTYTYDGFNSFEQAVKAYCGPLAWELIKTYGGWAAFIDSANSASDNMETFRAQARDMVLSIIERMKKGVYYEKAALPEGTSMRVSKLIDKLSTGLLGGAKDGGEENQFQDKGEDR